MDQSLNIALLIVILGALIAIFRVRQKNALLEQSLAATNAALTEEKEEKGNLAREARGLSESAAVLSAEKK